MNECTVHASGAVDLYFYGELPPAEQADVAAHLATCRDCRDALHELETIRAALAVRPDVAAPAGGDWWRFMARLDAAVAAVAAEPRPGTLPAVVRPFRSASPAGASYRGYLAMAALLALVTMSVLSVARDRGATAQPAATAASMHLQAPQKDPELASIGERHLERSKLVVLGMATKDARQADWEYERELAAGLLNDTRLYRMTAEAQGMTRLADVLRDLEIVLLQTSLTDQGDPEALAQIQTLIRKRDLLEQMEVVTTEGN